MRPKVFPNGEFVEEIPPDCLIVDKIHSAVVRIMGTKDDYEGVAPTVKVINLSIGDEARQLATEMSPLARLLDYLAYKYKVLFIVSAGNHRNAIDMLETDFEELRSKNIDGRSQDIYGMIKKQQRRMKMLSPGEQMNGLTIGALYDDYCDNSENSRMIYAVDRGLPSPISAFGRGYHSMIVPDLFYMGGRKFIGEKSINGTCRWVNTLKAPGCRTAAPFVDGAERGQAYSFGTSDATALITHEALKCYDVLCEIFMNETGEMPSGDLVAVLIKAMLTHGASWDGLYDRMSALIGGNRQNMEQWLGNGVPNVAKVESCAENRITLIGTGRLKNKEGDIFHLPLPVNISSKVIRRRLVVTLAYLSPIAAQRQSYRGVRMWFVVEGAEKLAKDRENTDFRRVQKGTLQHEIFVSDKAEVWDEENEVQIKVSCKRDVSKISEAIPYALFVTFEVAEGQDIDVYTKVAEKVKQMVKTT